MFSDDELKMFHCHSWRNENAVRVKWGDTWKMMIRPTCLDFESRPWVPWGLERGQNACGRVVAEMKCKTGPIAELEGER